MKVRGITSTNPTTFLSYNKANINEARCIAATYEKYEGIKFFFADHDIIKGDRWYSMLENAIYNANGLVVLLGPLGLSDYQNREIEIAKRRLKETNYKIFPVLLPGFENKIPDDLHQYQWTDYRKAIFDLDEHYRLVEAIKRHNMSRSSKHLVSVSKMFSYFRPRK